MKMRRSLENLISDNLGIVPSGMLAEILDDSELKGRIDTIRMRSIGASLAREATGALSTFALFNIVDQPAYYGASTGIDLAIETIQHKASADFRHEVTAQLVTKLFHMLPYSNAINTELKERGHPRTNYWHLYSTVSSSESTRLGISKLSTLIRPLVQAFSAAAEIPYYVIVPAVAATYLSLPLFSRLGERDKVIGDKMGLIEDGCARAEFYGATSLKDMLHGLRKKYWGIGETNRFVRMVYNKIPDIGFLAAAYFTKTDSMGIYRFIQQLVSTPMKYRGLRESELEVQRSMGFFRSMYDIMSGKPYLLTDASWNLYRESKLRILPQLCSDKPGIIVDCLETHIPDKNGGRYTPSLSFSAEPGDIVHLHGRSGEGKSVTTAFGLAGLVKTNGSVYFTDMDGTTSPMEAFTKSDLKKRVWYVSPTLGFDDIRICDIYQARAIEWYQEQAGKARESLTDDEILMLSVPDSQLEQQLYVLGKSMKDAGDKRPLYGYDMPEKKNVTIEGVQPIFPKDMFESIYMFREMRNRMVEGMLKERATNFHALSADQAVGKLSFGMKTKFMFELYRELYNIREDDSITRLLVVDEPLSALDDVNAREYCERIKELTLGQNPPVVIFITHTYEALMKDMFGSRLKHAYFENGHA